MYDPADGFFAGSPVGEHEHFVTSPHVSPIFGTLIASQLGAAWASLGRPKPFTVIEVGAGDGTLAAQVREAAAGTEWAPDLRYVCVEQSPVARGACASRGIEAVAVIADAAPERVVGCIIGNELLDNLPFHRVRARAGSILEVYVDAREGRLVETEGPATDVAVAAIGAPLMEGREQPASPAARAFTTSGGRMLARGYLLFFDYGFVAGEEPGPVRGYRGQKLVVDLYADPGSCDITGPVDFDAISASARDAGLTVWGPVSQRDALLALGYRRALEVLKARQGERERAGAWREGVSIWNQRGEAAMLIDRAGLGGLKVLAAGTDGSSPLLVARSG